MLTGSFAFTAVSRRRRAGRPKPGDPAPPPPAPDVVTGVVMGVAGGITVETLDPAPAALVLIATENGVVVHA